jgi:hypothetical protein
MIINVYLMFIKMTVFLNAVLVSRQWKITVQYMKLEGKGNAKSRSGNTRLIRAKTQSRFPALILH